MGLRYNLRLYRISDRNEFDHALENAALAMRGSVKWNTPGEKVEDLRIGRQPGVQCLYIPYQYIDSEFCFQVGKMLNVPWMELRIQEGSIWDYSLFAGDLCVDQFSVCPQYWNDKISDTDLRTWAGKPSVLAALWGLEVTAIDRYLVNWGMHHTEDSFEFRLTGKAYATDKYAYGDYEQFFDVLRILGGIEPNDRHRIVLPTMKS